MFKCCTLDASIKGAQPSPAQADKAARPFVFFRMLPSIFFNKLQQRRILIFTVHSLRNSRDGCSVLSSVSERVVHINQLITFLPTSLYAARYHLYKTQPDRAGPESTLIKLDRARPDRTPPSANLLSRNVGGTLSGVRLDRDDSKPVASVHRRTFVLSHHYNRAKIHVQIQGPDRSQAILSLATLLPPPAPPPPPPTTTGRGAINMPVGGGAKAPRLPCGCGG